MIEDKKKTKIYMRTSKSEIIRRCWPTVTRTQPRMKGDAIYIPKMDCFGMALINKQQKETGSSENDFQQKEI